MERRFLAFPIWSSQKSKRGHDSLSRWRVGQLASEKEQGWAGKESARKATACMAILSSLALSLHTHLPPSPCWPGQDPHGLAAWWAAAWVMQGLCWGKNTQELQKHAQTRQGASLAAPTGQQGAFHQLQVSGMLLWC